MRLVVKIIFVKLVSVTLQTAAEFQFKGTRCTWVVLTRLGEIGHAGVRAHEHIGRVETAVKELLLRLVEMNPAQRSLRFKIYK